MFICLLLPCDKTKISASIFNSRGFSNEFEEPRLVLNLLMLLFRLLLLIFYLLLLLLKQAKHFVLPTGKEIGIIDCFVNCVSQFLQNTLVSPKSKLFLLYWKD